MFSKNAKWLGCDKSFSAPVVIKKFNLQNPQKAVIDICGLGYYELFINGKRVGNEFFNPPFPIIPIGILRDLPIRCPTKLRTRSIITRTILRRF